MKKALNILFLSSWYPSRAHTTNGNFIKRHAEAISLKHKLFVLYVQSDINAKKIDINDQVVSENPKKQLSFVPKMQPNQRMKPVFFSTPKTVLFS